MTAYQPSVRELFFVFMQIGVSSFGGALPWARFYLVEKRKWLNEAQFTDVLTIASTVPGPNIINVAVYYGFKCRGVAGAAAACVGLLILPFFITVGVSILIGSALSMAQVKSALMGLTAAATGFMFAAGIKMMRPFSQNPVGLTVCVCTIGLGLVLHWPLPVILLVASGVAFALAWAGKI
jgi:chromate transporter